MTETCNKCRGVVRRFQNFFPDDPELYRKKLADFLVRKQRKDHCADNVQCLPEMEVRKDPNMSIADSYWEMQNKNCLGS